MVKTVKVKTCRLDLKIATLFIGNQIFLVVYEDVNDEAVGSWIWMILSINSFLRVLNRDKNGTTKPTQSALFLKLL